MMGFMAIASSVTFLVGCVGIHETSYRRDGIDLPVAEHGSKKGWIQSLSLLSGYDPGASFFGWLGNTLVLLAYPPVIIVGLTIGVFVGW
jgi:hypothetical protein